MIKASEYFNGSMCSNGSPESGPKGATEVLNGTKTGAFACVTRPKAIRATGLFRLDKCDFLSETGFPLQKL